MGRIKFRGGAMLAPLPPALVSCGTEENSNIITIAWTGILSTVPPKTYISVRPTRYSYDIIKNQKEFVINLCTASLARSADYCGMFTGRKVNKFDKCGLTRIASEEVACPSIAESPLSLECRVTDIVPLGSVDESLLDEKGKLHMERAGLCAYSHGEYYEIGKKIGNFGFSAVKPKKKKHLQKK